jgi:hypothetical protein
VIEEGIQSLDRLVKNILIYTKLFLVVPKFGRRPTNIKVSGFRNQEFEPFVAAKR